VKPGAQPDLFGGPPAPPLPEGLVYRPDFVTEAEEAGLAEAIAALPLKPFEFHGFTGRRRVASFGLRYDFGGGGLRRAEGLPEFLQPLLERVAAFAGTAPEALRHVLVTEYEPGAAIGWHRDRPEFGTVVGVSLLSPCRFRLRRRAGTKWQRAAFVAEPRSAYRLQGPARHEWEHSIPPVEALRWSITFRTLRDAAETE
jgi:alkylated DNA repair dioxygenase AlkB